MGRGIWPRRAVCRTRGSLRTMHGGGSAPSCCAFTHRVAFEEGFGPRVLLKSGPGNRGRSACGTTHVARLEFPRETGLILRCAGRAGTPSEPRRGIDSPVVIRRGEGAQMKRCRDPREKAGLKLNIQNTKIMASSPITSWQKDGKKCKQSWTLFSWAPK